MAVPRIKKTDFSKIGAPPKLEVAKISRKCRECGRYGHATIVAGDAAAAKCPWCGKPYGKIELGFDLPEGVSPDRTAAQ